MMVRLQKVIAASGVASRRAAETMSRDGHVTVNGKVVRVLGTCIDPVERPREDRWSSRATGRARSLRSFA